MSQKALQQFSQEYINEMAHDRENALKNIGVAIATLKNQVLTRSVEFTHAQIEDIFKQLIVDVKKLIDKELTAITIKTIQNFRNLIMGDAKAIREQHVDELKQMVKTLEDQVMTTASELEDVSDKFEESKETMKNENEQKKLISQELQRAQAELTTTQEKLASLTQQFNELSEINRNQKADIAAKIAVISQLKLESTSSEQNITEALAMMESQYRTQSQDSEEEKKSAIDDAVNQVTKEMTRKHEVDLMAMHQSINDLEEEKNRLKATITEQQEEMKTVQKLQLQIKNTMQQLKEAILTKDFYLEIISNSDLAVIQILLEMGGKMKIENLAKSVGMHADYLQQTFKELESKGLVIISADNQVSLNLKKDDKGF